MSKFAKKVAAWYAAGYWTRSMVLDALSKGKITQAECDAILGRAV